MTDYVKKPLNRHEMIATLERHLSAEPVAPALVAGPRAAPPTAPALGAGPALPVVPDPAAGASTTPPLDCASLVERFLGDWEFVEGILEKFQQQVGVDLEALERSIVERNSEQAALLAHRIKGAAANVSAAEISRVAAELERMGRAAKLDQADEQLAALRSENQRLDEFIRDELPAWTAEFT